MVATCNYQVAPSLWESFVPNTKCLCVCVCSLPRAHMPIHFDRLCPDMVAEVGVFSAVSTSISARHLGSGRAPVKLRDFNIFQKVICVKTVMRCWNHRWLVERTATEASLSLLLCSQRLLGTLMTPYDFPLINFAEFNWPSIDLQCLHPRQLMLGNPCVVWHCTV